MNNLIVLGIYSIILGNESNIDPFTPVQPFPRALSRGKAKPPFKRPVEP